EHGVVHDFDRRPSDKKIGDVANDPSEALSRATSLLSADLGVRAILVPTRTGRTARLVCAERPAAPVVALTSDAALCRRRALSWGLTAELVVAHASTDPRKLAADTVRRLGLAEPGDTV